MAKVRAIKPKKFQVEAEYETEVTFTCPLRGVVTQTVKVKRYESPSYVASFDSDNDLLDNLKEGTFYAEASSLED